MTSTRKYTISITSESYLYNWTYILITNLSSLKTSKFHVPHFMAEMMMNDMSYIDIFFSTEWVSDTEFDEKTAKDIRKDIIHQNQRILMLNDTHSIEGVGNSRFDHFRINSVIMNKYPLTQW